MNNPWLGWLLVVLGVVAGYVGWGWRGVVLAITIVAFWLLLQFSRALRALRNAAANPVGAVASAVMLNARLRAGQRLPDVLRLTRSLGHKAAPGDAADADETFVWVDGGGDKVEVTLAGGRVAHWRLIRAA